jgi:hypothetical protein
MLVALAARLLPSHILLGSRLCHPHALKAYIFALFSSFPIASYFILKMKAL